ncbi:lysozyme [Rhodobacterales bacterium]|nr:lysozyme [Rhodobacterales bacterium]
MNVLQAVLRALFYVAIGGVISIIGAAVFFMSWEPDRHEFPIRGIDVSHHQGEIDWGAVAQDDVAFAYIKASEGAGFRDGAFARNWAGAGTAGLARGAYHYFSLCKPGAVQAENFLTVLPRDASMLAPMVDLEMPEDCDPASPEDVLHEISDFTARVEQVSGKQVIFYAPESFYRTYLEGQGLNRRLWTRSIWRTPAYASDWTLWQYHDRGTVKGISGNVDLNVLGPGEALDGLRG